MARWIGRAIALTSLPLSAVEGRHLTTIEGIAGAGDLHPVQSAMVAAGGSQCGYCTPGFVVSLFCEYYRPDRREFDSESISGNLCRCTGYRPIADVARALPAPSSTDPRLVQLRTRTKDLASLAHGSARLAADAITGRALTAEIELLAPGADRIGRRFPLRSAGDPTLNVRLLLQEMS